MYRMDIPVIKETDSYMLAWKHAGLPVTSTKKNPDSFIKRIAARFPYLKKVSGYRPGEYGLLNRIDTGTSGVVLVAKTQAGYDGMKKRLAAEGFEKIYLAYCQDGGKRVSGVIDAPVAHHPQKKNRMIIAKKGYKIRGKPQECRTHFEKISEDRAVKAWKTHLQDRIPFPDPPRIKGYTWMLCRITKGKRHQIRVHLASEGYPVAGDALYGGMRGKEDFEPGGHALYSIGIKEITDARFQM